MSENEKGKLQIELMTLKEKVATVGYNLYQQVVAFRHERHLVLLEYLFYFMSLHTSFFHQGYHTMKVKLYHNEYVQDDIHTVIIMLQF